MSSPNLIIFSVYLWWCYFKEQTEASTFGIQFTDRRFRHNNLLALSFSKKLSSKSNKVDELAKESCTEVLDKECVDIFTLSVQDLAAIKVVAELNVERV